MGWTLLPRAGQIIIPVQIRDDVTRKSVTAGETADWKTAMELEPTEEVFRKIRNWSPREWSDNEFHKFMEFIQDYWRYADGYWESDGLTYTLHTVGWSDNEDIINAMQHNYAFWSLFWKSSERGGHYMFEPIYRIGVR